MEGQINSGKIPINVVKSFERHLKSWASAPRKSTWCSSISHSLSVPGLNGSFGVERALGKCRESGSPRGPWPLNRAWHLVCAEWVSAKLINGWMRLGAQDSAQLWGLQDDRVLVRTRSKSQRAGEGKESMYPEWPWTYSALRNRFQVTVDSEEGCLKAQRSSFLPCFYFKFDFSWYSIHC